MVIPKGFPKSVGRVGSRLYGFPCFPYSVISMACFSQLPIVKRMLHCHRHEQAFQMHSLSPNGIIPLSQDRTKDESFF